MRTLTGRTLWDIESDRQELLAAAREYGAAMRALARLRA